MFEWIQSHQTLLWALGVFSIVTFVGSLIAIPILVVRMPADYFMPGRVNEFRQEHPAMRTTVLVLKNVLGVLLILAGIAMLVLPGQGVLSILIGISFLNFPGKRNLELWIIRIPAVHRTIDWIRSRRDKPPLELPERR